MKRYSSIVLLVMLAFALAVPTAEAQKKKKKKKASTSASAGEIEHNLTPGKKVKASTEGLEKWIRVKNKEYRFAFAHPEEWVAHTIEHPDPDIAIPDDTVDIMKNDFNAIEVNREAFEGGAPYVLVYAVPKHHQTFDEYITKLKNHLGLMGAKITSADSTATFQGMPGYDVTYESAIYQFKVRTIVFYGNGMRYGLMYTANDAVDPKTYKRDMPRFERLLETLEIGEKSLQ